MLPIKSFEWLFVGIFVFSIGNYEKVSCQQPKTCTREKNCACKTDTGVLIDLKPFDIGTAPHYSANVGTDFTYEWQPCTQFMCSIYTNAAACQKVHSSTFQGSYNLGDQTSETFKVDPKKGLYVSYSAVTDTSRVVNVYLKCGTDSTPKFESTGEIPPSGSGHYEMSLTAPAFCFGGEGGGESNVGTILLAIFFVGLLLYAIIGVLFNLFYRKRSGIEVIPNHTFWMELPGLIKDGGMFLFGRCCRPRGYTQNI